MDRQVIAVASVNYPEPHRDRRRALLKAHPELSRLVGPAPITGFAIIGLVAVQTAAAAWFAQQPWWAILLAAYSLGAIANLGCWALIHEGAHNLIARTSPANRLWAFAANLPILVPAAATFRRFHSSHHRRQGEDGWDVDLPLPEEVRWVGSSPLRKAVWLALFMPLQVVRATRASDIRVMGPWVWANICCGLVYAALLAWFAGLGALCYLLLSSWFAMGLHPLGARWVQEHFLLHGRQETTSYYGPLNVLLFNCGHHNEHHDLPGVPWLHLPKVRRLAPEFYDTLYSTRSWTGLLWRFLTDRELTLANRAVRLG